MASADGDVEMVDDAVSPPIPLPIDPERHSVVNDFADYTEYFPSDMIRSLTLIRSLDQRFGDATQEVHEYAKLLGHGTANAEEAKDIRRKLSYALDQAKILRKAAHAEARRLKEQADRNWKRCGLIGRKLSVLPMPPSRDPTPVPIVSPKVNRKEEKAPKLTLSLGGADKPRRHRRVLVPGEVLPPPSASDGAYTQTDESSADEADGGAAAAIARRLNANKSRRSRTPRPPKPHRTPKALKIRTPGQPGTNVHSGVAGISTSNALAMLTPPPADAKPGSKFKPWFKLTEYEMAFLRKTMKKNAVWTPSDTMIRRYLREHQRGPEFYEQAKAEAEAKGEELLDEDPIDLKKGALGPGEVAPELPAGQDEELENRGMRLNVAKKEKAKQRKELAEKEAAELAAVEKSKEKATTPIPELTPAPSVTVAPTSTTPVPDLPVPIAPAAVVSTPTPAPIPIPTIETAPPETTTKKSKKDKSSSRKTGEQSTRAATKRQDLLSANRELDKLDMDLANIFSEATPLHETIKAGPLPSSSTKAKESKSSRKRKRDAVESTPVDASASVAEKDVVEKDKESDPAKETETPVPERVPKKLKIKHTHTPIAPKPADTSKVSQIANGEPILVPEKPAASLTTTTTVPLAPEGASVPDATAAALPSAAVSPVEARLPVPVQPTAAQSRPRRVSGNIRATVESDPTEKPALIVTTDEDKEAEAMAINGKEKEVKISTPTDPVPTPTTTDSVKERDLRPRSRGATVPAQAKAASAEPPTKSQRDLREKRRASVIDTSASTPAPPSAADIAAAERGTRAKRRPAPGFIVEKGENGMGKVSVSKRKRGTKKQNTGTANKGEPGGEGGMQLEGDAAEEDIPINPDEERYCICGDVSFGDMVACENECDKEWFHLECVGLTSRPTRRQIWYCPECREKLHLTEWGDPATETRRLL